MLKKWKSIGKMPMYSISLIEGLKRGLLVGVPRRWDRIYGSS
jgi:hypothetical protein